MRTGTVTGTPSIHSIPESDGPAPPVRVSTSASVRRPALCSSTINAAMSAGVGVSPGWSSGAVS